ncbi:MarR family transcriptional regulator [Mycolicibacterium rufum]|uniref:MarR family transcriptional regulator n=1 Tax=Mycolicibacterium rufum TaxID=318424 RepID=A0A9X2YEV2_9MYCO|nr:MarR family transcriptional regulator [Mycolicibacterium rufum]MCV7072453.1 MarR family transcriptional regulator [Mycolicibacterium rufum]ULP37581.1 MarR family transcriptional regulator [Mycolicibacterium rufum]
MAGISGQPTVLEACRALWRAMEDFDEAACRALGVGRSDLRALNSLEDGPRSAASLAEYLGLSRGSVTALIDRLEAARLVERRAAERDRRSVLVALRDPTWRALAEIYRPLGQAVAAAGAALDDRDRRALVRGLDQIATAFAQAQPRDDR